MSRRDHIVDVGGGYSELIMVKRLVEGIRMWGRDHWLGRSVISGIQMAVVWVVAFLFSGQRSTSALVVIVVGGVAFGSFLALVRPYFERLQRGLVGHPVGWGALFGTGITVVSSPLYFVLGGRSMAVMAFAIPIIFLFSTLAGIIWMKRTGSIATKPSSSGE